MGYNIEIEEIVVLYLILSMMALLIFSAFFSGSETAMMAVNRYQLSQSARLGNKAAIWIQFFLKQPERLIGMILIGNMFANNLCTMLVTNYFTINYSEWAAFWAIIVFSLFQLVFCEILPKTIAANSPNHIASFVVFPIAVAMRLLSPVVYVASCITRFFFWLFGVKDNTHNKDQLTVDELKGVLSLGGRSLPDKNKHILMNVLDIEHVCVEDVMLHKQNIFCVDWSRPFSHIKRDLAATVSKHALIYMGSLENIVGVLVVEDYLRLAIAGNVTHKQIRDVLMPVYYIPESSLFSQQMESLSAMSNSMGLVVDEYGVLTGMLTRDELSQFVLGCWTGGNLGDKVLSAKSNECVISGDVSVRSVNQLLNVELPTDGPVTLSGFVVELLECIPDGAVCVKLSECVIEVRKISSNVIEELRVVKL